MNLLYKPKMKYELSIRLTQKVCVNWTLHLPKKKVWTELWAYKKRKCELNIWLTQRESVDWTLCLHVYTERVLKCTGVWTEYFIKNVCMNIELWKENVWAENWTYYYLVLTKY